MHQKGKTNGRTKGRDWARCTKVGETMGEPRVNIGLGAPKWENQSVRYSTFLEVVAGLGFFLFYLPTATLTASAVLDQYRTNGRTNWGTKGRSKGRHRVRCTKVGEPIGEPGPRTGVGASKWKNQWENQSENQCENQGSRLV